MRSKIFCIFLLVTSHAMAENDITYEHSGTVDTSVNATSQEGFDCAKSAGKAYLLSDLPVFFSKEFGKAGLLRKEHSGRYKLAIVIDEGSNIIGYQVADNTDENSLLVKTILNLGSLPPLSSSNSCIAGKPFIFEFIIT